MLILDDGSTDGCTDFLDHIADKRIHLIKQKHNYITSIRDKQYFFFLKKVLIKA
ncbi:hypothetical protein [Alloprevotella rava]|uniref:hypothetical protein n=1 Tax=Alloprevotella rava TaxID=671218 RepID=UPI001620AE54